MENQFNVPPSTSAPNPENAPRLNTSAAPFVPESFQNPYARPNIPQMRPQREQRQRPPGDDYGASNMGLDNMVNMNLGMNINMNVMSSMNMPMGNPMQYSMEPNQQHQNVQGNKDNIKQHKHVNPSSSPGFSYPNNNNNSNNNHPKSRNATANSRSGSQYRNGGLSNNNSKVPPQSMQSGHQEQSFGKKSQSRQGGAAGGQADFGNNGAGGKFNASRSASSPSNGAEKKTHNINQRGAPANAIPQSKSSAPSKGNQKRNNDYSRELKPIDPDDGSANPDEKQDTRKGRRKRRQEKIQYDPKSPAKPDGSNNENRTVYSKARDLKQDKCDQELAQKKALEETAQAQLLLEKQREQEEAEERQRLELEQRKRLEEKKKEEERRQKEIKEQMEEIKQNSLYRANLRKEIAEWQRPTELELRKLDSSLKKCTGFVRKLKAGITEDNKKALLAELKILNLSRYVSEMQTAVLEAKIKSSDADAICLIFSHLHRVYADFIDGVVPSLIKAALGTSDTDSLSASTKLDANYRRASIKVVTELFCLGIIYDYNKIMDMVKDLVKQTTGDDKEFVLVNLSVIAAFAKHYHREYLGYIPKNFEFSDDDLKVFTWMDSLVPDPQKKELYSLIENYYTKISHWLESAHAALKKTEAENIAVKQTKGEIPDECMSNYEKTKRYYEKLLAGATSLAEGLGKELPKLPEDDQVTRIEVSESKAATSAAAAAVVFASGQRTEPVFEDEDIRNFYEVLPDLSEFLESGAEEDSQAKVVEEVPPTETDKTDKAEKTDKADKADKNDRKGANAKSSKGKKQPTQLDLVLNQLPSCDNLLAADSFSVSYVKVANKGTSRRLSKALFSSPPQKLNILPFFARIAASVAPYYPEVPSGLLNLLEEEFRNLASRKYPDEKLLAIRVRNARYIGELVKFKICPSNTVFDLLNTCLSDFTYHNIDVVCHILETCGRMLYRSPETAVRLGNILDIIWRLKSVKNLEARHNSMVEMAYFASRPPERAIQKSLNDKRDPLEEYVQRKLYSEMDQTNFESTLRQMRKLPWDEELETYIVDLIMKTERLRYSTLNLTALLIALLSKYHDIFGIKVIDRLLENIKTGLENPDSRMNQRRIAEVRLLGELCSCKMIDPQIVFEILYLLITYGHNLLDAKVAPDPPNNFFRVRLACELMSSCGRVFEQGLSKKRLKVYYLYFDRYVYSKSIQSGYGNDIPYHIRYLVADVCDILRRSSKMATSMEDAMEKVNKFEQEGYDPHLVCLINFDTNFEEIDDPVVNDGENQHENDDDMDIGESKPSSAIVDDTRPDGSLGEENIESCSSEEEDLEEVMSSRGADEIEEEEDGDDVSDITSSMAGDYADMGSNFDEDNENYEGMVGVASDEEDVDIDDLDEELDEDEDDEDDEEEEEDDDEDDSMYDEEEDSDLGEEDGDREQKSRKTNRTEEEDAFEKELSAMTQESVSAAKTTKGNTNVERMALPLGKISRPMGSSSGGSGQPPAPDGTIAFKMLVRKGGKHQTKELAVPKESALAAAALESGNSERAELQEMKRLVMGSNVVSGREPGTTNSGDSEASKVSEESRRPYQPNPGAAKVKKNNDELTLLAALFKPKTRDNANAR